jgi:hypothetical protein
LQNKICWILCIKKCYNPIEVILQGYIRKEEDIMFQKTDFWIGLAVGAVAGIFGYRFMQEREQQMAAMQQSMLPAGQVPLAELQRQKEELEDMIAAQEAAQAE